MASVKQLMLAETTVELHTTDWGRVVSHVQLLPAPSSGACSGGVDLQPVITSSSSYHMSSLAA